MIDTARRERIRARVREATVAAVRLGNRVTNPDLCATITLLSRKIAEIEPFFVDQRDERTTTAEDRWLTHAEWWLAFYQQRLSEQQQLVDSYGPNAELM